MPTVTMYDVASWIESGGDLFAIRFEPSVYERIRENGHTPTIEKIHLINKCSYATAQMIYSTSFGKFQIMGFNLYGPLSYKKSFFTFCESSDDQEKAFDDFLILNHINFSVDQLMDKEIAKRYALAYNGSLDYVSSINEALEHFGLK